MSKQKINKLLIGTNNKGKLREIKSLLPKSIKIHSTSEFNLKSPVENGKTFKENSLIKSKYFSKERKEKLKKIDPPISQAKMKIVIKEAGIRSSNKTKSKIRVKRKMDKDSIINLPKKLNDFVLPQDKYKAIPCNKPSIKEKGNIINSK